MTQVHVVLPDTVHRADLPSGGNTYDRRMCSGLRTLGWAVHEHAIPGAWPRPEVQATTELARVLTALPDDAVTLVDGLVGSSAADVLVPHARRLRIVVLVHMPLGPLDVADTSVRDDAGRRRSEEGRLLSAAAAVVTTSAWTRGRLLDLYGLDPGRLHVAEPGVDEAALAPGTLAGGELLCVAAVTRAKGHDRLLAALARLADLSWRCVCAGSLSLDPGFGAELRAQQQRLGLTGRVHFVGPLPPGDVDRAYADADVLVLASRAETYGMVVTEALARGLPVIATSVGGVPEALGATAKGARPGLLVPADDPDALAGAVRAWLTDADLRERLRALARERRLSLTGWTHTSRRLSDVLRSVSGGRR